MNSEFTNWYDELYRVFSDGDLLTVVQTIKLGACLRAIQAGENPLYHLNELLNSVRDNADLAERLDELIHAYIKSNQETEEELNNGSCEYFSNYQFQGCY